MHSSKHDVLYARATPTVCSYVLSVAIAGPTGATDFGSVHGGESLEDAVEGGVESPAFAERDESVWIGGSVGDRVVVVG